MKHFAILPILICSILLPMGAFGEIYKWVDKRGNPHFSDTPPPSGEAVYETVKEVSSSSRKESEEDLQGVHFPLSSSALYSGKPLYY